MPFDPNSREFTPPSASGYYPGDLFNFSTQLPTHARAQQQANFRVRVVENTPRGQLVQWRVLLEDVRGGLNATVGNFNADFDRISSSDADGRFYRTLILPQLTTNATTPDPATTLIGIHSINIFDTLILGAGSTADKALFKETSSTNPAIAAITYTPTGSITSLSKAVLGGATNAERLVVGRSATNAAQIISDNTGTVDATMHSDTQKLWGAIQTFINDDTVLFYSNGAIRYLDKTATVTDQPTVGLSNVPDGGYALGMLKIHGAPVRPYWVFPLESNTNGMLLSTAEKPGRVVSTNQEGTDYQEIPLGLKYVFSACSINQTMIAATDKERIVLYDGRSSARDLLWVNDREPNSDRVYECRGLFSNGQELWAEVNYKASPNATANTDTQRWWEVYNLETNSWHKVSASQTLSSTGAFGLLPSGALPLSQQTGFTHVYSDGSWRRIFVPVYGYNPYTLYRQTSAASSTTGNEYEASATYTSPEFFLDGIEGWPKLVSRIIFLGNVDAGGTAATAATVSVTAGNMTATFGTGHEGRAQLMDVADNLDVFYKLQATITLNRTTNSTRFTPNGLPVIIEGYAFVGADTIPMDWYEDVR